MYSYNFTLFILLLTISISYFSSLYEKNRLHKQNIKLKIKISDLAMKTDYFEEVIYKVNEDEKSHFKKLILQNKKIDAIRLLKKNHGMSLIEAKVYVETL